MSWKILRAIKKLNEETSLTFIPNIFWARTDIPEEYKSRTRRLRRPRN